MMSKESSRQDSPPDTVTELQPANFTIQIHGLLHAAQQSHGLAHSDYASYRNYLTNRISRLRHSKPVYNRKSGKRNVYQKREYSEEEFSRHENFILIPLYMAERAWAHAMEHKHLHLHLNECEDDDKGLEDWKQQRSSCKKNYYMKRLKKAVKHVDELESVVLQHCDETTQLEFQCYAAWMRGNYSCEKKYWESACEEYSRALTLSHKLLTHFHQTMELQQSDLFVSRADNTLQPLLRYCLYEWEKMETLSKEKREKFLGYHRVSADHGTKYGHQSLGEDVKESSETSGPMMVSFRGKQIGLMDASLSIAFIKIQNNRNVLDSLKKSHGVKAHVMDSKLMELLNSYDEAIDVIQKLFERYEKMTSGPAVNQKKKEYSSLLGYCKYEKLKLVMDRNESIVNDLRQKDIEFKIVPNEAKDEKQEHRDVDVANDKLMEEITHLYDILLQDSRSVLDFSEVSNQDENEMVEEDDFILEANAHTLRIRAYRSYYMGRIYLGDTVGKYKEALALFNHALRLAKEAMEEIAACQDMENGEALIQGLLALKDEIIAAKCRAKASVILARSGSGACNVSSGMNLLRRLDDFDSGGATYRLCSTPPALQLIAAKPFFFDIANNFVKDLCVGEIEKYVISTKPKNTRGLLRWFTNANRTN